MVARTRIHDDSGITRTISRVRAVDDGSVTRTVNRIRVVDDAGITRIVYQAFAVVITPDPAQGEENTTPVETITTETVFAVPVDGTAPFTYAWEFVSSPDYAEWDINTPTTQSTTFTANDVYPGTVSATFMCTVTDTNGLIATDMITVTATNAYIGP
jgi:hypothetical protein